MKHIYRLTVIPGDHSSIEDEKYFEDLYDAFKYISDCYCINVEKTQWSYNAIRRIFTHENTKIDYGFIITVKDVWR